MKHCSSVLSFFSLAHLRRHEKTCFHTTEPERLDSLLATFFLLLLWHFPPTLTHFNFTSLVKTLGPWVDRPPACIPHPRPRPRHCLLYLPQTHTHSFGILHLTFFLLLLLFGRRYSPYCEHVSWEAAEVTERKERALMVSNWHRGTPPPNTPQPPHHPLPTTIQHHHSGVSPSSRAELRKKKCKEELRLRPKEKNLYKNETVGDVWPNLCPARWLLQMTWT